MTTAGVFNHAMETGQTLAGKAAAPMTDPASGSNDSNDTSGNSATISANDFLTLLVTEMQNQDPTQATDPNEYINQLVEVNSLEQLIGINQTLTAALGAPDTNSTSGASTKAAGADTGGSGANPAANAAHGVAPATGVQTSAAGNLSVPGTRAAAQRVAHALDGRTHAQALAGSVSAAH